MIFCWNDTSKVDELGTENCPSQGIIQITGVKHGKVLSGVKAKYSGRLNIGVMPRGANSGARGRIYLTGQHRVSIELRPGQTLTRYPDSTIYGRVGSRKHSWYPQVDELGPLIVKEVYDESDVLVGTITNSGASNIIVSADCVFDRKRGGSIFTRNHGDNLHMSSEVWIFGSAYTVTEYAPGKVQIDKV